MIKKLNIYHLIGFIGIPITLYNLFYFRSGLNLTWLIMVAISIGLAFLAKTGFKTKTRPFFITTALIATTLIYICFPNIFVDDTGFVIRYFRQAADGCFYCYNASEGPVYGISSFLYGFVGSGIATLNIFKPEHIIVGLNFAGLSVMTYFLIQILYLFIKDIFGAVLAAIFIFLASSKFLASSTIGLETNFHLAIVFAAIYFFFKDRRKWMFLFMALSVISKLDTVPLMLVMAGIHFIDFSSDYFGKDWFQNWLAVLKFAIFPVLLFVGLTFVLFDGPLPQSAYAKIYHHGHPSEHWFPFWEYMYDKGERMSLMKVTFALVALHGILTLNSKTFKLKDFTLFGGFIATMVLFYLYNPAERMIWYYAMPEVLCFMQLIISGYAILNMGKNQIQLKFSLLFIGLSIAAIPLLIGEKAWMDMQLKTVEIERQELGLYISNNLTESDTIVASHGYFGAYTNAYVLDLSGLNSKLATDYKRNLDSVLLDFKPGYFIHHGEDHLFHLANTFNYRLDTVCFNINLYNYPTWTLFKRNKSIITTQGRLSKEAVNAEDFEDHGVGFAAVGNQISIDLLNNVEGADSIGIWFGAQANFGGDNVHKIPYKLGENTGFFHVHLQKIMTHPSKRIRSTHLVFKASDLNSSEKLILGGINRSIKIYDPIIEIYKSN